MTSPASPTPSFGSRLARAWLQLPAERRRAVVSLLAAIAAVLAVAAVSGVMVANGLSNLVGPVDLVPTADAVTRTSGEWDPNAPALPAAEEGD